MGVDAGQAEHEDGGDDEEKVKTSKTNQQAVDRALHLWPEIFIFNNFGKILL